MLRTNARLLIKSKVRVRMENLEKTIYSDEKWIEFILKQIIINAVKYRREGDCQIEFRAIELSEQVILEITDNGIGISPRDLPKVTQKDILELQDENMQNQQEWDYICAAVFRGSWGFIFPLNRKKGPGPKSALDSRNSMTFLKKEE